MQYAVDQALFKPFANVRSSKAGNDLLDSFQCHLPVGLALVFQVVDDPLHYLANADLLTDIDSSLNDLPVVSLVHSHSSDPEALEKLCKYMLLEIASCDTIGACTLRDDLEHDLLHFLVRRGELPK